MKISILVVLAACIISGDITYSVITNYRFKKWEKGIERDADGIRKGCREFSIGSGDTAVLLVHGFGDAPSIYHKFAPALSEMGFTCRAMRLPGFASPIAKYSKTSMKQWLQALEQEIQILRQTHKHVWIVAHSLGGAISIRYLLDNPQKADGLILLSPLIKVSNQRSPLLSAHAWHKIGKYSLFFTRVLENYFPVDVHEPAAKNQVLCDRFIPRVVYNEMFQLLDSIYNRARELNLPLLMVLSQDDVVVDSQDAEHFYQQISSPYKNIIFLENSGHTIPIDYEWKYVVSIVSSFIQRSSQQNIQQVEK